MSKNSKFLWLYTIVLFSVALILILFAGLSTSNYEKEIESHETAKVGLQKSITELSQTNMQLKEENSLLKTENEQLKSDAEQNQESFHKANENVDVFNNLASAMREYDLGNRKKARSMLESVDESTLTQAQLYLYNKIMK